jgi:hypothetical protein
MARAGGMTELLLKRSGRRLEGHYDFIAGTSVIGRIMLFPTAPTERPGVWTVAPGYEKGRTQTHGYEATKEAALEAFARSWHRQS